MIERVPLSAKTTKEIDEMLQERLAQVQENLQDESYPKRAPREIILRIRFEPDRDADEIITKLFSNIKLPARYGKKLNTVIRDGKILVEQGPEDIPMFNEEALKSARELAESGAKVSVLRPGQTAQEGGNS